MKTFLLIIAFIFTFIKSPCANSTLTAKNLSVGNKWLYSQGGFYLGHHSTQIVVDEIDINGTKYSIIESYDIDNIKKSTYFERANDSMLFRRRDKETTEELIYSFDWDIGYKTESGFIVRNNDTDQIFDLNRRRLNLFQGDNISSTEIEYFQTFGHYKTLNTNADPQNNSSINLRGAEIDGLCYGNLPSYSLQVNDTVITLNNVPKDTAVDFEFSITKIDRNISPRILKILPSDPSIKIIEIRSMVEKITLPSIPVLFESWTVYCSFCPEQSGYFNGVINVLTTEAAQNPKIYINATVTNVHIAKHHPNQTRLKQNYPNPFNHSTRIDYQIGRPSKVKLNIIDLNGKVVSLLVSGIQSPNHYSVRWDGKNDYGDIVPAGVYLIRLITENHCELRKATVLK